MKNTLSNNTIRSNTLRRMTVGAYIRLFWYLLRHKWHVFHACIALDVPFWQALIHDWSKFRPSEFIAYASFFHGEEIIFKGYYDPGGNELLDMGRNFHQNRNPHHWQYWVFLCERCEPRPRPLPMPERYVREMVADWVGAGRAQEGQADATGWYARNRERILLHPETRCLVEQVLSEARQKGISL